MQAADDKDKDKIPELSFAQKLAKEATVDWQVLGRAIEDTYRASVEINKTFGQGQERLSEMMVAVADATPKINRLGGEMKDVQEAIIGVAEASRRNVIANTEDVEKLYAATRVLDTTAESLSNAFLDVGVGIGQVGEQLEDSVNYVRSIGGNTKAVMKDVQLNMEQMNRYQFVGGVQGLTKMAAQASMLRFDMNQTFQLADKVLDPENAIEVAAAFQRLGVSAGDLADPFQLMNQSINDPSGLQNSLAEVSKQFTYFDEETKTFKINPQGVLTLREMEKQTGVSAKEMAKMGLAAAELDQRLSAVNMAGLNVDEEDKQYLANIAQMGKGGEYEVKLRNDEGDEYTKKLTDVTQTELNKLLEEQKTGPKSLEEIARLQLTIDEAILGDVKAIRNAFTGGVTTSKQVTQGIAGTQRVTKTTLGEYSGALNAKDFRDVSEGLMSSIGGIAKDIKEGNMPYFDALSKGLNSFADTIEKSEKNFGDVFKRATENIAAKLGNQTIIDSTAKNVANKVVESYGGKTSPSSPITSNVSNKVDAIQNNQVNQTTQTTKGTVDVGGKITVDIQTPTGMSTEQSKQFIDSVFNDPRFKDYIIRLTTPESLKEPVSKNYK